MITKKQETLAQELYQSLKEKFPEIEPIGLIESPADPDSTWLNIVVPDDEDREIEILEFAAEQATDILLDQDEHFSVMTDLYSVEIEFPHVKGLLSGDREKKYHNLHQAIGNLIRSRNAGRMGGMSAGRPGSLVMFCHLRSLDFAQTEIPRLIKRMNADEKVIIRWDQHGYPFKWDRREPHLYPPTGDGAV